MNFSICIHSLYYYPGQNLEHSRHLRRTSLIQHLPPRVTALLSSITINESCLFLNFIKIESYSRYSCSGLFHLTLWVRFIYAVVCIRSLLSFTAVWFSMATICYILFAYSGVNGYLVCFQFLYCEWSCHEHAPIYLLVDMSTHFSWVYTQERISWIIEQIYV